MQTVCDHSKCVRHTQNGMLKEGVHNTPNMETYRTHLIWCPRHTLFLDSVGTSCNNCTGVLPPPPPHTQRWCPECFYLCFSLIINRSYSANCSKLSPQSFILTLLFHAASLSIFYRNLILLFSSLYIAPRKSSYPAHYNGIITITTDDSYGTVTATVH